MSEQPGTGAGTRAGWYPDPWHEGSRRYWTGSEWTAMAFPDVGAGPEAGAAARAGAADPFAYARPSADPTPPGPPPAWVGPDVAPPAPPDSPVLSSEETIEASPRGGGWRVGVVVAVAAALAVALIAGFVITRQPASSSTATARPPAPSIPAPAVPSPTLPTPSPGAPLSSLAELGLRQSDVDASILVEPIDGGQQVKGETTLDLCDGDFPSESLREQRVQVAGFDLASGAALLSTEAVIYRGADAIDQVHRELDAAAARCAETEPGASIETGIDSSWPRTDGVHRQAYRVTAPDQSTGEARTYVAVYLTRGNVLLAVYFPDAGASPPTVAGASTVPAIVKVFEERLLSIPSSGLAPGPSSGGGGGLTA